MDKIEDLFARLPHMDAVQLREEWFRLFYAEAPPAMSSKLMRLALAYRIQELENDAEVQCRGIREQAAAQPRMPVESGFGSAQQMGPGTRLLREYEGKTHEVLVIENGRFVYGARIFKSLSEVARQITGTPRSGPEFFGLKGRRWRGMDG